WFCSLPGRRRGRPLGPGRWPERSSHGAALLLAAQLAAAGFLGRLFRPETWSARAAMYGDAVRLLRRSPWLGQGGDTWRQAFRHVQSHPYVGSEVHSGYLDLALDLGLFGLALVLLWLGVLAIPMLRRRSAMLPSCLALLLHAAVDFDMSYGLFWLLLLWMAAIAGGEARSASADASAESNADPRPRRGRSPASRSPFTRTLRPAFCGLSAFLLLALSAVGFRQSASLSMYQRALALHPSGSSAVNAVTAANSAAACEGASTRRGAGRKQDAATLLQRALKISPDRTSARIALATRSESRQAVPLLLSGLDYEPADAELWLALGSALARAGNPEAVPAFRRALELDRFDRAKHAAAMRHVLQLSQSLQAGGRPQEAQLVALAGAGMYAGYAELADAVNETPVRRNDRRFRLTAEALELGKGLNRMAHPVTGAAEKP
ncbi:O-antigen ligase family protein, partial [Paenibacillus macerans]|uniref:O-antigen ligase family protein n=1 Tax=Paenibacillus macerans TaxID=44252 RepID=UPI003D31F9B9